MPREERLDAIERRAAIASARETAKPAVVEEKVTLAEAKDLGFSSTKGITKKDGVYYFDPSLAPDRGGFQPVGVGTLGVQMTPYYGDVTGDYRLTQEQYFDIWKRANGDTNLFSSLMLEQMGKNETAAKDKRYNEYLTKLKEENPGWTDENIQRAAREMAYGGLNWLGGDSTVTPGDGTGRGGAVASLTAKSTPEEIAKAYEQQKLEMEQYQQRQSIISILSDRFARYNLQSLIPVIKQLAQEGASESTITLALKESEEYKKRFKANEIRQKNNLTVLEPAEYLNLEDKYRQVLRAYGLEQFNNDNYVSQFIENDVSVAEFTDRISAAVQRVQSSDPQIMRTLRDFYGIQTNDLVAYVLDPNQQFPKVQQQIAAAEIGAAARTQGIEAGSYVAEQLAAQGISKAEAQRGYATIASLLPTAEKLSQIYGSQTGAYTLTEAEQEVFGSLASAQRKRQELAQKEISAFGGASGLSRTALSNKSTGGAF